MNEAPNNIIRDAMLKIAAKPTGPPTRLVYCKARRTILEVPIDPTEVRPLKIYDEDADFNCS